MQSQYLTVNTTPRQVPIRLLSHNIKAFRETDGAIPVFPFETLFLAAVLKPSHLPLSVSPLLNAPLELLLLQLRKKKQYIKMTA